MVRTGIYTDGHLRWLKAIATFPHFDFNFVDTMTKRVSLDENVFKFRYRRGSCEEKDTEVVKHLIECGILWRSWHHSDEFTSAMMALAWKAYTAKSLEIPKNVSGLIIQANP